jgi:hypothetical protein
VSSAASSVAASSDAKATVPVAAVMEQVMDTASNKANMDFLFISFFLFYFSYFRTIVCTKKATAYSAATAFP